jgi:hypothetical protein
MYESLSVVLTPRLARKAESGCNLTPCGGGGQGWSGGGKHSPIQALVSLLGHPHPFSIQTPDRLYRTVAMGYSVGLGCLSVNG